MSTLTPLKERVLTAASAWSIPPGRDGLWRIHKLSVTKPTESPRGKGKSVVVPPGHYTQLFRLTEATMHLIGELVMHDFPDELNTHLTFMMQARGQVLVTGLGLGCCVRGALVNPAVEKVTVIERDPAVLRLVAPHMPKTPRLEIILADAVTWLQKTERRFDTGWHDLWSDPDQGEASLQLIHSDCLAASIGKIQRFGTWQMPSDVRHLFRQKARHRIL